MNRITDCIMDQMNDMRKDGKQPTIVIIGEEQADRLMEAIRKMPLYVGNPAAQSELLGLHVIVDPQSKSRIDVIEEFSFASWYRRKHA